MEPLPTRDPNDTREPVGCVLHPADWEVLKQVAGERGVDPDLLMTHPVLGTNPRVDRAQPWLIYDVEGAHGAGVTWDPP